MNSRGRQMLGRAVRGAAIVCALLLCTPVPASYAEDGDLVVTPMPAEPMFTTWDPGTARHWLVDAELRGAPSGTFQMRVTGSGDMVTASAQGLRIEVRSCTSAYAATAGTTRPGCGGTERLILPNSDLSTVSSDQGAAEGSRVWRLPNIIRGTERHFLVSLTRPPATSTDPTIVRARFGVGFYASGDSAVDDDLGGVGLPGTGGPARAWFAVGIALLLAGSVAVRRARR